MARQWPDYNKAANDIYEQIILKDNGACAVEESNKTIEPFIKDVFEQCISIGLTDEWSQFALCFKVSAFYAIYSYSHTKILTVCFDTNIAKVNESVQ